MTDKKPQIKVIFSVVLKPSSQRLTCIGFISGLIEIHIYKQLRLGMRPMVDQPFHVPR